MQNFKRPFSELEDKTKLDAWSDKNPFKPDEIGINSSKNIWFDCVKCGHDFTSVANNVTNRHSWCPFCANRKVCDNVLTCGICLPKTFYGSSDIDKINSWSDKNDLQPWEVFRCTNKKYWSDCNECGHEFDIRPNDIVNGKWCPYCSNNKLCTDSMNCEKCLPKTFYGGADEYKVSSWSDKNTLRPWQVFWCSAKKMWFDCAKCGHEFKAALTDVKCTDTWCPYCVSKKLCEDTRICVNCLPKTFYGYYSDDKIQAWSDKNTLRPWQVFLSSSKKFWFHCQKCVYDFECAPDHVIRGNWCPKCSSKRNKAMNILLEKLKISNVANIPEDHIVLGNRNLNWDAKCILNDTEFYIESDGPHHFSSKGVTQVSRGSIKGDASVKKFKDQRTRDLLKEEYIIKTNGILFRFSYRQTKDIPELVEKMISVVSSGRTGVFKMDPEIYW